MNGPAALVANIGRLKTRMGQAFIGERAVFRGHDLHAELLDMDWIELFIFGITGRRFGADELRLLHAMWVCTSYPDARIWNNRVAALAGTTRSTPTLGITAALAVSEATIYGGRAFVRSIDFLQQALQKVSAGMPLKDVVEEELRHRRIYGYGRPLASVDERLPWLLGVASELKLDGGPHLKLALELEALLVAREPRLRMNYAALMAALAADLGLTVRDLHLFQVPVFLAGMAPCYIEASEQPAGTLFPLPCAHVAYEGSGKRSWHSSVPFESAR